MHDVDDRAALVDSELMMTEPTTEDDDEIPMIPLFGMCQTIRSCRLDCQSCKKATGMRVLPVRKACKMGSQEGFMSTHYIMYPKHQHKKIIDDDLFQKSCLLPEKVLIHSQDSL